MRNPDEYKPHWLELRLKSFGDVTAFVHGEQEVTYKTLLDRIDWWRSTLESRGVRAGDGLAIESDYSPEAVAAVLAGFFLGTLVMPLASIAKGQIQEFLDTAEIHHHLTFHSDNKWDIMTQERVVTHPLLLSWRQRANPGLILWSSGSTGKSKASLLDFESLTKKFQELRRGFRTLVFLLLDHIGGINTLFHTLSQGGTVVTARQRTPREVCAAIAAHRIQLLPTTPTFLKMLLMSEEYKNFDLSSLEVITYGTEPMPEMTLHALHEAMPGVTLKQTYGLSEVGIMPTRSKSNDSLWVKLGEVGFQYKIIDNILFIKSDAAMLGYLNAPSPFDEDGYMNTQDLVEVDGDYVRILGRISELINVGGEKVYPQEVENVILQLPEVLDVTVFGKSNAIMGKVVAARILPRDPNVDRAALKRTIQAHCRNTLEAFKVPMLYEINTQEQHSDRFKKARSTIAQGG